MNKGEIILTTQGVKGGNTKITKCGYFLAELRHGQDRIIIDDFEGQGDNYKKRELTEITIIDNGDILFEGNKFELFELLKSATKKDKEQMKIETIKENLCNYDIRNPNGVASYLTQEELKEEGYTEKAKNDCYCDNCFYGKTTLAQELLKYVTKSLVD